MAAVQHSFFRGRWRGLGQTATYVCEYIVNNKRNVLYRVMRRCDEKREITLLFECAPTSGEIFANARQPENKWHTIDGNPIEGYRVEVERRYIDSSDHICDKSTLPRWNEPAVLSEHCPAQMSLFITRTLNALTFQTFGRSTGGALLREMTTGVVYFYDSRRAVICSVDGCETRSLQSIVSENDPSKVCLFLPIV